MTARANISVDDGMPTPVSHQFTPDGDTKSGNEAVYVNFNSSVPAASERIFISVLPSPAAAEDFSVPGRAVQPRRVKLRIRYPATYTDAVSGLTLVDYVDEVVAEFKIHPRSSEQRAENLRQMLYGLITYANSNQVIYAVDKGQQIW